MSLRYVCCHTSKYWWPSNSTLLILKQLLNTKNDKMIHIKTEKKNYRQVNFWGSRCSVLSEPSQTAIMHAINVQFPHLKFAYFLFHTTFRSVAKPIKRPILYMFLHFLLRAIPFSPE